MQTFEGVFKFLLSECDLATRIENGKAKVEDWFADNGKIGNIVVIGGLVVAFVVYSAWQQRNGRAVTQAPAKPKKVQ